MKAVVLAAGEGLRLRPLTSTRPKHMLPVGGAPLLEHTLVALRTAGIRDVAVIVGYIEEKIRNYFQDGSSLGISLTYITQRNPSGTANAVGMAEEYVNGEDFIAVYGDLLLGRDVFSTVLRRHGVDGALTMAVVPVANPRDFGVITVKDSFVKKIAEKPKGQLESNLINAGVYVFPAEIFRYIRETGKSARGEYEITDTLQSLLNKNTTISACPLGPEEWLDIGRPWDLLEANSRLLGKMASTVEGEVEEGAHIIGPVVVRGGARVRSGAYIEGPVFVGEGSDVGPNCYLRPCTSLGRNVRVGNACEIKNSIIMDGTHVGHLSYVGDSVLGEDCNLGAGTITANLRLDDGPVKVLVKDIVVDSGQRKLGAFLGDGVKTGIGVSIMPGIKIGMGAWIGPGAVVRRDVPEEARFGMETS
jgi:bifunctional UDP-N-acetylglucosamine pyrophosphorylase/glucosamine-1-phosphate N-acetyltransferase